MHIFIISVYKNNNWISCKLLSMNKTSRLINKLPLWKDCSYIYWIILARINLKYKTYWRDFKILQMLRFFNILPDDVKCKLEYECLWKGCYQDSDQDDLNRLDAPNKPIYHSKRDDWAMIWSVFKILWKVCCM